MNLKEAVLIAEKMPLHDYNNAERAALKLILQAANVLNNLNIILEGKEIEN